MVALMKKSALAGVVLTLVLMGGQGVRAQDPQGVPAVVQVWWLNADDKGYPIGTAFHVGNGVFFTNGHIVNPQVVGGSSIPKEFDRLFVRTLFPGSQRVFGPATITCIDSRWHGGRIDNANDFDVATFRIPQATELPFLRFAGQTPGYGTVVHLVGFPAVATLKQYTATAHIDELTTDNVSIRVDAGFAWGGSSGSPVLNTANEIVGIVFGRTDEVMYAVPLPTAIAICKDAP